MMCMYHDPKLWQSHCFRYIIFSNNSHTFLLFKTPPSHSEAAYYLGFEFFHGNPLPKNREMAKYWLTKIVDTGYQDQIQETDFEEAKDMLMAIENGEQEME